MAKPMTVLEALLCAQAWNNSDLRNIDEITPNEHMLKTRRKVLRDAIKAARVQGGARPRRRDRAPCSC